MMIYFYQNKSLHMYPSYSFILWIKRTCKLFVTYYLLEVTLNCCIFYFTISLFSLINGEAALYITIDLTIQLNDKETVNRSCF